MNIVNTVSLWCAIGLLWWSFCSMLGEHFSEFLQVETAAADGKTLMAGMDWWAILLWMVVLWVSYDFPEQYLRKGVLLVRGLALAIPIGYAVANYGKITKGIIAMLEIYFPYVNNYYQTDFSMEGGMPEAMPTACTFIMMVFWLCCWLSAYGLKKKILLAVFPAFALGLELAVGLSPVSSGLLAWFVAAFVLLPGGKSILSKVLVLAGTLLGLACAQVLFGEEISFLATNEQKQAVIDWQEDLKNFNPAGLLMLDFHFDKELLRNEAPPYTGKVIFEITTDKRPKASLYFRGFYGTEYRNHTWKYDTAAFSKACADAGISKSEAARELFNLTYEQTDSYYKAEYSHADMAEYQIKHVGTTGNVAYVPYASAYETLDETYTFMGDYLLKKSVWDDTVEVAAVVPQQLSSDILTVVSMVIDERIYLKSAGLPPTTDLGEWKEELDWYNELALEYLQVPEDMAAVSEAAEKVKSQLDRSSGDLDMLTSTSDPYDAEISFLSSSVLGGFFYGYPGYGDVELENSYRLRAASAVANYLGKQMSYSLILDDLPAGADPVEYALTESHEGYCMHFASAGTLILRKLGVPARYVSGYVVKPGAFLETENGYYGEVTDYAAHAWVEIYLDYIGWIPVEVTPGYNGTPAELPTEQNPEELEAQSNTRKDTLENSEEESQIPEESESLDTEETESTENESGTESDISGTGTEEDSESGVGFGGSGTGDDFSGVGKVLGILSLAGILVFLLLGSIRHWKKRYDGLLEREMKKNHARKAVKRMNRRIYVLLRMQNFGSTKRMPMTGKLSDAAFEKALIATFPVVSGEDWQKYMEIVRKMHYSLETISIEEMMHCYRCYQKAGKFNKILTRR